MGMALEEARKAEAMDEVPTGAVIIEMPSSFELSPGQVSILSEAHNETESSYDPTAHAELLAIRKAAAKRGDFRLTDTILYVTKEPCAMCAGAIVLARIPIVVWGLSDPRRGGESAFGILSSENLIHRPQIIKGIMEDEARMIIQTFFRRRRVKV